MDFINNLENVLNERDFKVSRASIWALSFAKTSIERGVTENLVIETLLTALCDSHDRLNAIKTHSVLPKIEERIHVANIINKTIKTNSKKE